MPQYKLMYFNARGRAENVRMLFALNGQDFEDFRFQSGDWPGPELKGNADLFPLGQAPVLIIDGKALPQSRAIARHVARELGSYGANNAEAAQIDVVTETVDDITAKLIPVSMEKDEAKKAEALATLRDSTSKPLLTYLNSLVKKAGGSYFVGKSVTIADISVYTTMEYIFEMFGDAYMNENYPDLVKFRNGITENSPLKSYIAKRPVTSF